MSQLKQPNFLNDNNQYAEGWNWYSSHFASARKNDLCSESSVHHQFSTLYILAIRF